MCGILAIFNKSKTKHDMNDIGYTIDKVMENCKMLKGFDVLKKRGPDTSTIIRKNNIILGFTRLAIVDTSITGNQPFIEGDISMMCNGEIYNHKDLEEKYDLKCKSKSDCECILHLYKKIGFEKTVRELDGVFAIVLVDGNQLFMARDRIGVRPLFTGTTKSGNFVIASVAGALTGYCNDVKPFTPGILSTRWDVDYIGTFKPWGVPNIGIITSSIVSIRPDYRPIKNVLTNAVKKRLMSDRQICCMLSGGLDSSLITSIMCKLVGAENVRTYSIGMEGSIDLEYARKVAEYLGTNHHEVLFTPQEGFDCIPNVIRDLECYDITTIRASVGMWLLSKHISENTEDIVLFSGEGADELFCGYLYFHHAPDISELEKESVRLVNELYLYDVLRADRCVSSHGLELRVPFLDKDVVDTVLYTPGCHRKPIDGIEKKLLRDAFRDDYLPDDVLWRRKDGFSDGVSGKDKSWYQYIEEFVDAKVDQLPDSFPSKEAYYYKKVYDELFPTYQPKYDYWMPKWIECYGNPSGRVLDIYNLKDENINKNVK